MSIDQIGIDTTGAVQDQEQRDIGLNGTPIGSAGILPPKGITQEGNFASQVLNEGRLLAGLLHHEEFSVAHLMLVISRIAEGAQELSKWDVQSVNVNQLCWKALERQPALQRCEASEVNPGARTRVSDDIMEVHRWAGIIAAGKKQRTLELADLVEAVVASRISPRFIHLYATEPAETIFDETRGLVKDIKSKTEEHFPLVQNGLTILRADVQTGAQVMQKEFRVFAMELNKEIADGFSAQQSRTKNDFRKLRYIGFALLAILVIGTALLCVR